MSLCHAWQEGNLRGGSPSTALVDIGTLLVCRDLSPAIITTNTALTARYWSCCILSSSRPDASHAPKVDLARLGFGGNLNQTLGKESSWPATFGWCLAIALVACRAASCPARHTDRKETKKRGCRHTEGWYLSRSFRLSLAPGPDHARKG